MPTIIFANENRSVLWSKNLEFCKDPSDVIDYTIDLKPLLKSDAISTITIDGTDITIDTSSFSGNVATIWVSGGSTGRVATVKMTIVTTNTIPRTFERSFKVRIEDL